MSVVVYCKFLSLCLSLSLFLCVDCSCVLRVVVFLSVDFLISVQVSFPLGRYCLCMRVFCVWVVRFVFNLCLSLFPSLSVCFHVM